ncbi:phosphopantetheine-binding protein [Paracoccus sp. (in: a-proteobacteria)]|uniref:phosphopantetheine-binding protein n=1 Tax=Paracoccus sp. TaxID=267 RepID=UPI002AFE32F7|nr:phosphopantetheine-binding protein [Paracoccus sp. (in: a-proteobacteria)]
MTAPTLDQDWLTGQIATMIDEGETPAPEESLILFGLDSIRVMEFVALLKTHGISVSFEELIRDPSIAAWWALIDARRGQAG